VIDVLFPLHTHSFGKIRLFVFFINDLFFFRKGSRLRISRAKLSDAGTYTCQASNVIDTTALNATVVGKSRVCDVVFSFMSPPTRNCTKIHRAALQNIILLQGKTKFI